MSTKAKPDKQAVILIHGIGEQEPMQTLRRFVDAMWTSDPSLRDPHMPDTVWSKPDWASRNLELRRLTTVRTKATATSANGTTTDFYELYWAHLMSGTRLSHVLSWVWLLLFRKPAHVPKALLGAWVALWVVAAVAVAVAINQYLPDDVAPVAIPAWLAAAGALLLGFLHYRYLVPYVGDAARYLSPAPVNVEQRKNIREAGIELLETLIEKGGYERIVVVGHSLGTIIGYDVLRHLWPAYNTNAGKGSEAQKKALRAVEKAAAAEPFDRAAYRRAQRAYLDALRADGNPWNVTDFVTFGSPLAHAEALMARDSGEFEMKKEEREFPTAPPVFETKDSFTYARQIPGAAGGGTRSFRVPHHGAVFAPVRWTNLYFPSSRIVFGDIVGGPVAPAFGPGVEDVAVTTGIRGGIFNHTDYFTFEPGGTGEAPGEHVAALRKALNLLDG